MSKRIHVVVNPAAGQPQPILSVLNRVFNEFGVRWDVDVTHEAGDGLRLARAAVEAGAEIVAAYGGDGTIMEVANGLMGTDVPLAILPGGTGDVFSIELGIPQPLEEAVRLACSDQGEVRRVDVGQTGDRYFLLRLATGFTARQIQGVTRELRDQYGKFAYFLGALQALPQAGPVRFGFLLDGQEEVEFEGVTCIVANAGRLGISDFTLAPDIDVSDGLLDVFAVRGFDLGALGSVAASIAALNVNPENMGHWRAREVTIRADPVQPVVVDGEDCGETPVRVQLHHQALHVIVPAGAEVVEGEGAR
ncbi:MAG TPA: diacylglycerol kinase family protein [Anaerolineae bacterium]|nr:diacylglycerol kinase family protein [Anaerolineae bacterium]